eukprot:SAG31_NODE_28550_length_408_cov_1.003236_1_plen_136_part_11
MHAHSPVTRPYRRIWIWLRMCACPRIAGASCAAVTTTRGDAIFVTAGGLARASAAATRRRTVHDKSRRVGVGDGGSCVDLRTCSHQSDGCDEEASHIVRLLAFKLTRPSPADRHWFSFMSEVQHRYCPDTVPRYAR